MNAIQPEWIDIETLPQESGWYLVVQDNGILRHRFARQFTVVDGWKDLKEDKYGDATHWTFLPGFPPHTN